MLHICSSQTYVAEQPKSRVLHIQEIKSAHLASGAVSHVVATRRAVVPMDPLERRANVRWALVNRLVFHHYAVWPKPRYTKTVQCKRLSVNANRLNRAAFQEVESGPHDVNTKNRTKQESFSKR